MNKENNLGAERTSSAEEVEVFTGDEFQLFFNYLVGQLKLSDSELCDRFDVSEPIVQRYKDGSTFPQPRTRTSVIKALLTEAAQSDISSGPTKI